MMILMVMSVFGMSVMMRILMIRSVMMSVMSPSLLAAGDGGRGGAGRLHRKLVLGGFGRLVPGGCRYSRRFRCCGGGGGVRLTVRLMTVSGVVGQMMMIMIGVRIGRMMMRFGVVRYGVGNGG